ncbi:unnamed protein product [Closterium sp. Naga37s-1]|nr:unnamed protein product [Closterium sp. Naga37s-1]
MMERLSQVRVLEDAIQLASARCRSMWLEVVVGDDSTDVFDVQGGAEKSKRDGDVELEASGEEEGEAPVVAPAPASRPTTSGKSIRRLAQHLTPRAWSVGSSGEFGGKSPVRGPREFEALAALPSKKLAEEILRLDCELESKSHMIVQPKKRLESRDGGIAIISYEELAAVVEKAQRQSLNAAQTLEREAKLLAMEGVVTDSMEGAQKKLTDEVSRKIDNMSSAVSATAERAITTSEVTHALNTLIALVSGSAPPRADAEEPHATETAEPGDTDNGKRVAASRADNQRKSKSQRGPAAAAEVRNPSVQDMLKQNWGAGGRGAGQPAPPGQHGPSAGASAVPIPVAVEPKSEKRGRGAKKQPPPSPAVTIDDDNVDAELEDLVMMWVGPGDNRGESGDETAVEVYSDGATSGVIGGEIGGVIGGETGTKRRGYGICDPPWVGPGKVFELHLGGKKRWLGHGPLEDMQYVTTVALMPYDQ